MITIDDLRVDVGGVPEVDGLSVQSTSNRVAWLGGGRALFDALAGVRTPSRGRITIDEVDPRILVRDGALASAPLDPTMPLKWTAHEHASWNARLAGRPAAAADKEADGILRELGVEPSTVLDKAALAIRRAVVLAGAIATGAKTLVIADPSDGLAAPTARQLCRAACKALEGKSWALFASSLPIASPFALEVEEAFVVRGSRIVARGAPGEIAALDRSFTVRALGDVVTFARLVEEAGGRVSSKGEQMAVDLGAELQVHDLFALAEDAKAALVEVVPLGRAFG
jgi:ABC-type multidrug transport system ATPase subunit